MVIHVAMFHWTPDAEPERIEALVQAIRRLPEKIVEIKSLWAGQNQHPMSRDAYDFAIVITFASRADLDSYRTHPAHLPVTEAVGQLTDRGFGIDFEDGCADPW